MNCIIIGCISFLLIDISQEYLPYILDILVILVVLYLTIKKICIGTVSDTFKVGKIDKNDTNKIKKNIVTVYLILAIIETIVAFCWYVFSIEMVNYMESNGLLIESITGNKEEVISNIKINFQNIVAI